MLVLEALSQLSPNRTEQAGHHPGSMMDLEEVTSSPCRLSPQQKAFLSPSTQLISGRRDLALHSWSTREAIGSVTDACTCLQAFPLACKPGTSF